MVTYQSVLNAEYYEKLGKNAEPLEIAIQPFRVKVEELYDGYHRVLKHIKGLEKELEIVRKKIKLVEDRSKPKPAKKEARIPRK
jgi:hypothetical protein